MRLLFPAYPIASVGMLKRQLGCVIAFQSLLTYGAPLTKPMSALDVALEPLIS